MTTDESPYDRIVRMQNAINTIAPWLSSSLDSECCDEYVNACNQIFELDSSTISE